jgi:ABC-type oligopeptide transport system ATPase subunit
MDLQQRLGLTLLLVAHDLRLVRHICARLAVMYHGRIVETGRSDAVFQEPAHPYTRALISAMPGVASRDQPARVRFDARAFDARVELREVAPGHWAAV